MEHRPPTRARPTRERLRTAAHRLFLQQGYLATSIEAILAEAGISSRETFYRHYASKEALFADILGHLTMEKPEFLERLATFPRPDNLSQLKQTLTCLAREIIAMLNQPGYLPLVRMIVTEAPRFPQLGTLFFSTVTRQGLSLIITLLEKAREQHIIADLDFTVVAQTLLGGLLTAVLFSYVLGEPPPAVERADAVVEIIIRALAPQI